MRTDFFFPRVEPLTFAGAAGSTPTPPWGFTYDAEYRERLRTEFGLDRLIGGCQTELARLCAASRWVSGLWRHNGYNQPAQNDPIFILREVARGQRFRCVEYSIVLSGVLQAVGIPARILGLKRADMESRQVGAGHVVAEAYLADMGSWVMVDSQWNAIPVLDDQPLHAVALQQALAHRRAGLRFLGLGILSAMQYRFWIAPYLHFFDVVDGSGRLMLVPEGVKPPTVFQRVHPLTGTRYTHSLTEFYPHP